MEPAARAVWKSFGLNWLWHAQATASEYIWKAPFAKFALMDSRLPYPLLRLKSETSEETAGRYVSTEPNRLYSEPVIRPKAEAIAIIG